MQAFRALSYRDMWRVSLCLRRGEAPEDPRLAPAAVDLAEGYRRRGRTKRVLWSWYLLFTIVLFGYLSISAVTGGDQWKLILYALVVPVPIVGFVLDPGRRPKNVARSLEASRRMLPADWSLDRTAQAADDDGPVAAGWCVEPDNGVVERLWDGEEWTSWARPRSIRGDRVEADPAGWQPHPSKPGREILWSGDGWTDRERDSVEES
ncbi:MAG: hypothetical protein QOE75_2329 [Solirubrobacterales bacterium]|nr:hypothetical protein [Solirubrobacterales bacterium]